MHPYLGAAGQEVRSQEVMQEFGKRQLAHAHHSSLLNIQLWEGTQSLPFRQAATLSGCPAGSGNTYHKSRISNECAASISSPVSHLKGLVDVCSSLVSLGRLITVGARICSRSIFGKGGVDSPRNTLGGSHPMKLTHGCEAGSAVM